MAIDTLSIADRLERSGVASPHARAIAAEFADMQEAGGREREALRRELVTREYLDLALAKLRAELERDIAGLRSETERSISGLGAETERSISGLRTDMERLRTDMERLRTDTERLLREQTNKIIVWLGAIVGIAVTLVGGLGVLF